MASLESLIMALVEPARWRRNKVKAMEDKDDQSHRATTATRTAAIATTTTVSAANIPPLWLAKPER